ncbi:MAG: cation diffusion facilitator family transporter [Xanthomonadales bacterium]|nr:cation diffusion facilitator family transporter [Xanthomonadales bacterium]
MGGGHHHHHPEQGDRQVLWAVVVNLVLTAAQMIGGLLSGSLALLADAVHNLSDALALGIAFAARRIARLPSNHRMTFGYVRAELVAALINYTTLIVIGLTLVYQAFWRFFEPSPINGWMVVIIAGLALVVDLVTAALTWRLSRESINIRAAFLHNVADALGSIGVILAGTVIIVWQWNLIDPLITLAIAGYILWHALSEIGQVIRMLMLGTPDDVDLTELVLEVERLEGVEGLHHVHVWNLHEHQKSLEGHLVVADANWDRAETIKQSVRACLRERFDIGHTTLELEAQTSPCHDGGLSLGST